LRCGYIRSVLSGAAPAVVALFLEGVVWDTFIAVAGLQSLPVASGEATARQAIREFASGGLAEVERGANGHPGNVRLPALVLKI